MQNCFSKSVSQVLGELGTSAKGLDEITVQKRLDECGKNQLVQKKSNGLIRLFLSQFADVMVIMLVAAAVVSGVLAYLSKDTHELFDTIIIVFIIFINAVVGFVQQYRADKAIEQLKKMSVGKTKAKRDGVVKLVDSTLLVPGDVVLLEQGDMIPADCRIISCSNLACDESSLTGESTAVVKNAEVILQKNTPVADVKNMVFSSCFVTAGSCEAVVVSTGMDTQIGKIATMLDDQQTVDTPLQKNLDKLGKVLSFVVIAIAVVIFAIGAFLKGTPLVQNFMSSVAIAVAAIPEGLPAVVTIIMAMGMQKMSKSKAIVRKLHAVETLGSCNYICTDKTGTLTQNKMQVVEVWSHCGTRHFANCMHFCSSVKGDFGSFVGDPTEVAIKNYIYQNNVAVDDGVVSAQKEFDSVRKLMTVCADDKICYTKGAPDLLVSKCAYVQIDGKVLPLDRNFKKQILTQNSKMASQALRVIGFAYKQGNVMDEKDMVFVGLCGMADPPRPQVYDAVKQCKKAGVTTVMITGDHKQTAFAIAKNLGIADDTNQVVTGEQLDEMTPKQFSKTAKTCRVYARVTPRHKNLIVKELQSQGNVVAMTGDGINDAPGIKSADIGIAMGVSGTDVTKNASDMIVADDNFATIVLAVKEGRRIFANIKKTIHFFLATNLAEVLAVFFTSVFFPQYTFLLSSQLLWINLVTDSFPVLALGTEREEKDVMSRKPQKSTQNVFDKQSVLSVCLFGVAITVLSLVTFFVSLKQYGNLVASTMTFFVISFAELFHALNVRSDKFSLAKVGLLSNKPLVATIVCGVAVNVAVTLSPVLQMALGITGLSFGQWMVVFATSLAIIPVGEVYKFVLRKKQKGG
ncbi:MAG: cation-translocating P-type ATPase [Clostridia bacterium]|nr:cation-translocating P-type ATPase [Clostridia bacterium]